MNGIGEFILAERITGASNSSKTSSEITAEISPPKPLDNDTSGTSNDYTYDANGNMLTDKNKGITNITYNHLNQPNSVVWSSTKKIDFVYNADGQKVKKVVTNGSSSVTTEYLDGFQYNSQMLEFFPHAEG